jgi:acyl transferase domain-containing protein
LYNGEPVFRDVVDQCAELLSSRLKRPLIEVMGLSADATLPEMSAELSQTANTQPALFVFEYALAMLWRSWGVVPQWVAGHSVGEYVAACLAGVFSLEDALDLVAERGRLMQALPAGGAMAAVFAPEAIVLPYLVAEVSIAAANGPHETVISGPAAPLRELLAAMAADGLDSRPLDVSHAFHSVLLDPMLDEFEARCARVSTNAPRLTLISNLTGKPHPAGTAPDARYWRRHARETVRFADCLEALRNAGATVLLELGPQPTLVALAQRAAPEATWTRLASVRRGRDDHREALGALQALYIRGLNPLWAAEGGRRVALPTYPFQRSRYWMSRPARGRGHPMLGERQVSPTAGTQFLATMTGGDPVFQAERARCGRLQLPFAHFLDIACAAARASGLSGEMTVSRLRVERALEMADGHRRHVHTAVTSDEGGMLLQLRSAPCEASTRDVRWQRHVTATLHEGRPDSENTCPPFAQALLRCSVAFDGDLIPFGSHAARLFAIQLGDDVAVAEVVLRGISGTEASPYADVIGLALQLVDVLLGQAQPTLALGPRIAIGLEDALLSALPTLALRVVACLNATGRQGGVARADLRLETTDGAIVALMNDVAFRSSGDAGEATDPLLERWPVYSLSRRWVVAKGSSEPFSGRYALLDDASDAAREFSATLSALLAQQGATLVGLECPTGAKSDATEIKTAFAGKSGIVIDCRALWPLVEDAPRAARVVYQRSLNLLHTVTQADPGIGICVLTRGALRVADGDAIELQSTVLPGLLRTAAAEDPSRPILLADLDPGQPLAPEAVVELLRASSRLQPEVAWRGEQVLMPSLVSAVARTDDSNQPHVGSMPPIRADGTYLISGGLGGIGMKVASWLVDRGAGGIVLLGRQPATAPHVEAINRLRESGCRIECASCNVGDMGSLDALRSGALATLPPIRGVFHAAGVLADASIPKQDAARFEAVARAKLDGSWCLHRFTQDDPIEMLVLFSSVSGTFGAPGQANYAAANTFLDGLAAWRHARGQPALSIGWGAWSTDGMAARLTPAQQSRIKSYGMGFLESAAALDAMASIPTTEPVVAVLEMAPERLMSHAPPGLANLLRGLGNRVERAKSPPQAPLPTARTAADGGGTLEDALIGEVARALGFEPSALELDAPLSDLGLDSMMAIQLRGAFAKRFGVDLPLRILLEGASTRALVAKFNEHQADRLVTTTIPDAMASTDEVAIDEGML